MDIFALRDAWLAEHPDMAQAMEDTAAYLRAMQPKVRTYTERRNNGILISRIWDDTGEAVQDSEIQEAHP